MHPEAFLALVALAIGLALLVGAVCGIAALIRQLAFGSRIERLERLLKALREKLAGVERTLGSAEGEEPGKGPARPPPEEAPELSPEGKPDGEEVGAVRAPAPVEKAAQVPSERAGEAPPPEPPEPFGPAFARRDQEWWKEFEESIGKRWIIWVAAVVLFLAAGLFVKYEYEHDLLGATGRVVLGVLAGLALLVAGDQSVRRRYRALGQGLTGAGLAVLYAALFAASSVYDLIPREAGFGAMILVTAAGMSLAVLHDAVSVSFLAILGGVLTPVLLSTGRDQRDALFAYLVLLDCGVLGVAFFRRWRALDVLAFAGTWALFTGWFVKFYDDEFLVPTLLWLGAFYAVFLLLPFVYHLRRRTAVTVERFIAAVVNAVVVFGYAYGVLHPDHKHVLGFIALGMAGSYLVLGSLTRTRIPKDARALFGFIALSVTFLTLAVPLHLGMHGITLAWAVEGPVLLYLGYRYGYFPVRAAGVVLLALAAIRLFARHWPLHTALYVPVFNRHFASAMFVPLAGAAYAAVHQRWSGRSSAFDRGLKTGCAIGAGFLALIVIHAEAAQYLGYMDLDHQARYAGVLVWALGAAAFLAAGLRTKCLAPRVSGLIALFAAAIFAAWTYGYGVRGDYILFLNGRFAAALVMALVVFAYPFLLRRHRESCPGDEQRVGRFLAWAGVFVLFLLLSAEAHSWCRAVIDDGKTARWMAQMSVSVVWGVYATGLLGVGFRRRWRPLRFVGLGLFGLTALKLVLVDMAAVKEVYRIVSFLVLGLLMVGASYLYHRIEKTLAASSEEKE